jgi:hypothetical protein
MKALISTLEPRQTGYRVAQTSYDDQVFPVAESLFWVDFPSDLNAELVPQDFYWYDPTDETIKSQDITEE